MSEDYLTPEQAAEFMGVSRPMLYKHVQNGRLNVYRQKGNNKLSFFSREELKELKGERNQPEFIIDISSRKFFKDLETIMAVAAIKIRNRAWDKEEFIRRSRKCSDYLEKLQEMPHLYTDKTLQKTAEILNQMVQELIKPEQDIDPDKGWLWLEFVNTEFHQWLINHFESDYDLT